MWTIVLFTNENQVELVPSNWINENKCAWTNRDAKKKIKKRADVIKDEFQFYDCRILKSNIGE